MIIMVLLQEKTLDLAKFVLSKVIHSVFKEQLLINRKPIKK